MPLGADDVVVDTNKTEVNSLFFNDENVLDISEYLSQAYGFLPVPVLITEPAVGYGAGVALVYLHDKFIGKKSSDGRYIPASISGVVALGTQNSTKFGGAFHIGYYFEDRLRTITFIGYPSININFYKNNSAFLTNVKGPIFYQTLKGRVGESNLFLGGGYMYSKIETSLNPSVIDRNFERKFTTAAIELVAEYDARDNTLSPNRGYYLNAKAHIFNKAVGNDSNFERYSAYGLVYIPLNKVFTLESKLMGESIVGDDAPFYTYPFLMQRGIRIMRYQGEHTASAELQLRWEFIARWSALLFGGAGKAFGKDQLNRDRSSFSEAPTHYSKGVGVRYLIAEKFGLRVGVDVASSEHDKALYIQFGSVWSGF